MKIDRIVSMIMILLEKERVGAQELAGTYNRILTTMQTNIKIRIHPSVMDRVLDFCSFDAFSPDGDAHYIVSFPFIENEYHYDILLSFGSQCECLEPPHVRAQMKRKTQEMAALYACVIP